MSVTPETWLASVTANEPLGGGSLHGILFTDPQIISLTNGNVLVAWATNKDTGASSPTGADIVGQLFDQLGNKIGGEFLLNQSFSIDDESSPSIAATSGGGFIVAYSDNDAGNVSLRLDEYDSSGSVLSSNPTVISDTLTTAPNYDISKIAVSSDSSAMIVYEKDVGGGDVDIYYKIYNPSTNTYGSETALMIGATSEGRPAVTTLVDGNYVVVAHDDQFTSNSRINMAIVNSAGLILKSATIVAGTNLNSDQDSEPDVTALTGGGFVVSWTSNVTGSGGANSDVKFQLFDVAGTEIGSVQTVNGTGVNASNDQSAVVALNDGGFIVVYDNDETSSQITAQRYDSTGTKVGNEFDIDASGHNTGPQATLMADGRVAVTFFAQDAIQMQIIDPRDSVSLLGVSSKDYVVGTINDDTLIVQSVTSTQTFGWAGDDSIGIDGFVGFGDIFDGGAGTDTFTMAGQTSDYDIDLGAGRVRLKGDPGGGTLSNFENIIGGKGDDILTGNSGKNEISGGGGADDLYGKAGADTLSGGGGNDNILGGGGRDNINGGKGADSLSGEGGNDKIVGGGGGDSLQGGGGRDKLIGGAGVDTLVGGAGGDTLKGGGGDDLLRGGLHTDILLGGGGNDRLEGGLGSDRLTGGAGADVFVFTNFAGEGIDTITDYNDAQDRIDLQDFNFSAFADVLALTTQVGANLEINFGGGDKLIIENFLLADFNSVDVIL
jgi:Ca2+-binding RTX toxin-like protein